jgi:GTPase SAR1 family protein
MIALQNVFDKLIRKLEVKILILGFKGAGKTTILKRFEFGDIIKISYQDRNGVPRTQEFTVTGVTQTTNEKITQE